MFVFVGDVEDDDIQSRHVELIKIRANDTCARCDQSKVNAVLSENILAEFRRFFFLARLGLLTYMFSARRDRSSTTTQGGHISKEFRLRLS